MRCREFVENCRQDIINGWRPLADKSAVKFDWPVNCPIEVRELVGPERFDSNDPKFMMPFFWRKDPVPASPAWGIIVCAIEWSFGVIFLLLYSLHYIIVFFTSNSQTIAAFVCFITFLQLSIFFSEKVLFVIAIIEKNARLLKQQLIFQYVTCVFLLLNATFTYTADMGGYNEAYLFGDNDSLLIRITIVISVIFIIVELYLRLMTKAVYTFINETKRFRIALDNSRWRYRKRVYFSYCSIRQQCFSNLAKSQNTTKPESSLTTTCKPTLATLNCSRSDDDAREILPASYSAVDESCQTTGGTGILRRPKQIHYNWRISRIPRQRQRLIGRKHNRSCFNQAGVALLDGCANNAEVKLYISMHLNSKYLQRFRLGNSRNTSVLLINPNQYRY